MFGSPKPRQRGYKATVFLRCLVWGFLLACVTQVVPRMVLLNDNSNDILAPLLSKNDLYLTSLKAISASRFTAAGCLVGLIYTAFALIISIFVRGNGLFVLAVFDFAITIVVAAAVALTASYTPLNAGTCRSITPASAEPKTILYASLYEITQSEDGASQCIITLASTCVGLAAAAIYAVITALTVARAISSVRARRHGDQEFAIDHISEPIMSPKPSPVVQDVAIPLLAVPEPSLNVCAHHCCCESLCRPTGTSYQPPTDVSTGDDSEQPPPYEESEGSRKGHMNSHTRKSPIGGGSNL